MCGRYRLSTPGDELWESFDIHGDAPELIPRWNIAPTQPIAVVRDVGKLELVRWGLAVPKGPGINVRVESMGAPLYRDVRRCLVLADGFYEWKAVTEGAKVKKLPYLFQRIDGAPFAFAGLWRDNVDPHNGEVTPAAAIITGPSRGVVSMIHDRMPVILPSEQRLRWLEGAPARELLVADADGLQVYAVSTRLNSGKLDEAGMDVRVDELNSE